MHFKIFFYIYVVTLDSYLFQSFSREKKTVFHKQNRIFLLKKSFVYNWRQVNCKYKVGNFLTASWVSSSSSSWYNTARSASGEAKKSFFIVRMRQRKKEILFFMQVFANFLNQITNIWENSSIQNYVFTKSHFVQLNKLEMRI